MYNKNQFRKMNEKKVLHKVRKHWVVVSAALLMMIGGKAVTAHVARADVGQQGGNASAANTVKNQLNANLVKANQLNRTSSSNSANNRQLTPQNITNQAQILHNQMMTNAATSMTQNGRSLGDPSDHNSLIHSSDVATTLQQSTDQGHRKLLNSQFVANKPVINASNRYNVANNAKASDNQTRAKNNSIIKITKPQNQIINGSSNNGKHPVMLLQTMNRGINHLLNASNVINGTWGVNIGQPAAKYSLDLSNGQLTISDGYITRFSTLKDLNPNDQLVKNEGKVRSIIFKNNVMAPLDSSSYDQSGVIVTPGGGSLSWSNNNDVYNPSSSQTTGELFPNQSNLTSIDASGLNTSDVKSSPTQITVHWQNGESIYSMPLKVTHGMFAMFAHMPQLQSLTLGNHFNTNNVATTADMFRSDNNLKQITIPQGVNINPKGSLFNAGNLPTFFQGVVDTNNNQHQVADGNGQSYISEIENGTQPTNTYYKDPVTNIWGSAFYNFDPSTGTLTVHDGQITRFADFAKNNPNSPLVKNESAIKHVVFRNATAPADSSAFDEHMITDLPGNMYTTGGKSIANNYNLNNHVSNNDGEFFPNQRHLQTVDVSGLNTSNVKGFETNEGGQPFYDNNGMDGMFADMQDLTSVTFGGQFNTSNAPSMVGMFMSDPNLTNIDLSSSSFDPQNVSDMHSMFMSDNNLHTVEFGNNFNTGNVTNMSNMFTDDKNLSDVYGLSDLDVHNVTDMSSMFAQDLNLKNNNFSKWDTHNVNGMYEMFFSYDSGLTNPQILNLSNFDTRNVKNMHAMFYGANFKKLILGDLYHSFDTSNVRDIGSMFAGMGNVKSIGFSKKDDVVLGYHFALPKAITYGDWTYQGPDLGHFTQSDLESTDPNKNPLEKSQNWFSAASTTTMGFNAQGQLVRKTIHPGFVGENPNITNISLDNLKPGSFDGESLLDSDDNLNVINLANFYLAGPEVLSWYHNPSTRLSDGELQNQPTVTNTPGISPHQSNPYKNYDMLTTGPDPQELVAIYLGPNITFKKASDPIHEDPNELPGQAADGENYLQGTFFQYRPNSDRIISDANLADDKTHPGEWFRDRDGVSVVMYYDKYNQLVGNPINVGKFDDKNAFKAHLDSMGAPNGYSINYNDPKSREIFTQKEQIRKDASGKFYVGIIHLNNQTIHGSMDIPADLYNSDGTVLQARTQVPVKLNYVGPSGSQFYPSNSDVPGTIHARNNNYDEYSLDPTNAHGTITPSDAIYWNEGEEPTVTYRETNNATDTVDYVDNNTGKTLATQYFSGKIGSELNINENNAINIPDNYDLVNPVTIPIDNKTHKVPIQLMLDKDNIVYHDIYGNVDGMSTPVGKTVQGLNTYGVTNNDIPAGWALVDQNGKIVDPSTYNFNFDNGEHVLNVAPVYDGLTYKYNQNNKSVEFIDGHITWNGSNDPTNKAFIGKNDTASSDLNNATSIKFDSDADLNGITNASAMFKSNEAVKSLELPTSFVANNVTTVDGMFDDDASLQSLTLPNSFDTHNVNNMGFMFNGDSSLRSLNLPNTFDTSNVTTMNSMFNNDASLQSLNLPNVFNTGNVVNMNDMFNNDASLQSLNLPNVFSTNNVTNMNSMFKNDASLQSLVLPALFDTSKVKNMSDMFGTSDGNTHNVPNKALRKLIIQSPNTKLIDRSSTPYGIALGDMYELENNDPEYTSPNANDFSQGNVGTFVRPANPAKDTVNFVYKDSIKSTQQVSGDYEMNVDVTSHNAKLPMGYQLVNPDNYVRIDAGTHNINITPIKDTDTINYIYNGKVISTASNLSGNDYQANGVSDTTFDINSNNEPNMPSGYHLVNANNTFNYDDQSHNVPVDLNPDTLIFSDIYHDVDGLNNPSDETIQASKKGEIAGQTYHLTASDVPAGWALVDQNGHIVQPNHDTFTFDAGQHHVMIAPVYDGLTYKYDKNNNSVEFVDGNVTWNGNQTGSIHIGGSFIGSEDTAPDYINNATSIKIDSDANLNNVTDASSMFGSDYNVESITLPNTFIGTNLTAARGMFYNDKNLKSLNLPDDFDPSNVTDMECMFALDPKLSALTLPNSFNTSNAKNMGGMFSSLDSLHKLVLPAAFDTSNVTDMSDMFGNAYTNSDNKALRELVIQSPKTKLYDKSGSSYGIALGNMYRLDPNGDGYTSANANDFGQGNVGTFIRPANPKVVLKVQYKNQVTSDMLPASDDYTLADQIPGTKMTFADLGINNLNTKTGQHYKVIPGYTYQNFIKPTVAGTIDQTITVPVEAANVIADGQWDGANSAYYTLTSDGTLTFSSHGKASDSQMRTSSWSYAKNSDGQLTFQNDGFDKAAGALNRNSVKHVQFQGDVELPSTGTNHKGLFENMNNLTSFNPLNVHSSDVTSTEGLFASDPQLTRLDLSSLKLTNDQSTENMFANDANLVNVDLSNDANQTNQLTNVSGMFRADSKLTIIGNIDHLNTSHVDDMNSVFVSDTSLPSDFEIPDWQSSQVADFSQMFANDSNIKTLNIKNMMTSSMTSDNDTFENNHLNKIVLNKDMRFDSNSKLDGNWMSPDYKNNLQLFSPRPVDNLKTNLGPNQSATWLRTNEQPISTKLYNQAHTYINTQQMYQPLSGSTITPEQQLQLPNGYDWAPSNHVSDGITNQDLNYNRQNETAYVLGKPETEPMTVTVDEDNGLDNVPETITISGRYGDTSDDEVDANAWTASDRAPVGYTLQDNHGGVDVNGRLHYNFNQGAYVVNANGGWNRLPNQATQPNIHYTAQKESVQFIFENGNTHAHLQSDTLGPVYTGQSVTLPKMPAGYTYQSGPQPNSAYQITSNNIGKSVIIDIIGDRETVPVEFIDQNDNRIGNVNYSLNGRIGTDVNLMNVNTPNGYVLNAGQPSTYSILTKNVNPSNHGQTYPVFRYITGQSLTMRVQYELTNGTKVGNVVTTPNVKVGDTVNLTANGFPDNYLLASGYGNPKHYQLSAADISSSNHNETNVLPVYVIPAIQPLTIDYVNADGHTMLDRRTVSVKDGTQIYLTNNDVTNNKGTNANGSFVKTDQHLLGYVPASNQDLTPTAEFMANNHYPVYTVKMQSLPVTVHVTYHDPATGSNVSGDVGSDVISKTGDGKSVLIGDTVNLPTSANANQHGLDSGYTLDQDQPQRYQITNVDTANGTSATKNLILLAHGDHIIDRVPVTVKLIGSDGRVQGYRQVTVPIDGEIGDRITFNSSDFTDLNNNASGYVPQGYTMAPDYVKHAYTAELMSNDISNWQSDSWQINHNGKYWYNPNNQKNNGRPLVVLQANPSESITVRFFNQNHQQVGSDVAFTGDYGDAVDLKDPSIDNQSVLKDRLPKGYHYGSNNQSSMVYGQEPETANVNVMGNSDLIDVQYNDPINHQVAGSIDDSVKSHVGDQVTLPTNHLPQGYRLVDGQSLSYDVNPNDETQPSTENKTGLIIHPLNVTPKSEVLPIKFVDQNGHQIGDLNYQIHGMIGQTNVALPSAPAGYTYASNTAKQSNPSRYNFIASQINTDDPDYMQVHTVYLNGDQESVPVRFVDQNGTSVPNGSTVISGHRIGDTFQLPSAPRGYVLQSNQPTKDTLTSNDVDPAKAGYMKPVKIYVRTTQNYSFDVIANENVNGTFTKQIVTPLDVKGSDETSVTFKPSDSRYAPIGFRTAASDHPATTQISDAGLTMLNVAWTYDATNSKNNHNPNDHTTAQPIYLTYYDEDTHQNLKGYSDRRIDGYMTQTVDVVNPQNGGIAVPRGYVMDDSRSTVRQITTTPQHVTLNVKGVKMSANDFRVDIDKEFYRTPDDHQLTNAMTSQSVPETGAIDSSFTIDPNASHYVPQGYHLDMINHARDNQTVSGQVTDEGLKPSNHQFYYVVGNSLHQQDGVQPIHVTYYDDQTGAPEGTSTVKGTNIVNGYMDETFNVGQLGTNGLAKGYTVDPNQTQTYTISTQPTNAHVMVHGNQSKNDQITIRLYKEDPYGNVLTGQPSIVYADVAGNTGDQYDVSANDYLPNGYQLDTSHGHDQDLRGTIQADGKLSNGSVSFYYQLPKSNETNLNPIHVMYEDDNDHDIVEDEVIMPSAAHDDYVGKFIDVVADNNADNHQSPVPQGYDIDSNQYTQAAFSQKQPTYIDVLVHADQNSTQYNDTFNRIEQFYYGNELVTTDEQPKAVKGVDGSSFTFNAPSTPVGYVAEATNPAQVSGYVEQSKLVPGNALYKFSATNSTNYNHSSDHNHAQPIFVTFKNGNVIVGKSDQRIDGYMSQMVDALAPGHLNLPNGYQLANGTNTVYQIGTNVQHQIIQVVPKTVSATVNYIDQKDHDLVAQRSVNVPLGTKLAGLTNQYVQFVPYDFNYVSHDWNDNTQVVNNGQYTIYVARQQDRAQPRPASDQNAGIIDVVYQDHAGNPVATYELSNANAQPFNAADYIKARSKGGQMPDDFSNPKVVSQTKVTAFNRNHPQTLVVQVAPNARPASAKVEYEDAKTHQMIKDNQGQILTMPLSGHAGDAIDYATARQFVPQGYTYYGMGDHDNVIENGDVNIVMVRKAKPAERLGQINVTYKDSKGNVLDTVNVSGIVGKLFNLDYYENDLPTGYEFNGVDKDAVQFADHPQNVTIRIDQPKVQNYGKVTIHFVKADANIIKPNVNGNQGTPDDTLKSVKVPGSYDETMTGHIGDLFNPQWYEHNTPQGTTFSHVVKGNNISMITKQPQSLWIAVQTTNGRF